MDRFAIVVDGTASFSAGLDRELDIRSLPLHVDIGDESFTSGVDLTADEFYKKIAAPDVKPGTSQPSMGECRDVYDRLVSEGFRKAIVLTIAAELSGTYSVATTTAQQMGDARIEVVDTRCLAGGISLIGTACARARRDQKVNPYTDLAMTPVTDEETETLEMFTHNAGARDQVAHRAGNEDFVRARCGHDPRRGVHVDPARLAVMDLALTDVQTGARLEADRLGLVSDRGGTTDRLPWPVEGREEPVAGGVHLMTTVARERATDREPVPLE